ncbi:MAG TPA: UDP-glucose 4-epimerase GalE, partial [Pirellulales bacterium]
MRVLVTGGAGYIGSHMTRLLADRGHSVVVVDDLRRGNRKAVDERATFAPLDVSDVGALTALLVDHRIECVMHFAALAYVAESVEKPLDYYRNNVSGGFALLEAVSRAKVGRMVFSSSCATYGVPESLPIVEELPQRPINPYGWSKLFMEQALRDLHAKRPDFAFAALRYFNVCGASSDGKLGEDHRPETHVIPRFLFAALGRLKNEGPLKIFGTDYDTPDGTCVRDYIHVADLADAHLRALDATAHSDTRTAEALVCNLGNGDGFSVR